MVDRYDKIQKYGTGITLIYWQTVRFWRIECIIEQGKVLTFFSPLHIVPNGMSENENIFLGFFGVQFPSEGKNC